MNIVGKTTEGSPVVSGIGKMYFQEGIPLSVMFDWCKSRGMQPSFKLLYDELTTNGMSRERIIHLLNENIFESYGKEYRDTVISRL